MGTVRADCRIFGYRKYKVPEEIISEIASGAIRVKLNVYVNRDNTVIVRERDRKKMLKLLSDISCNDYEESLPLGLFGYVRRIKYKGAVISGIVVSALLVAFFSGLVWDIRIEGNEKLSDAKILSELERCGFSVGDLWALADNDKVCTRILAESRDIGWISINRRGTVAYVSVIERVTGNVGNTDEGSGYANIIASKDCIIEDITVKRGQALVKKGDSVKKGDVLVLGALPEEAGGAFCRAEAEIIGRVSDKISVAVDRNYEKKTEILSECRAINIQIFGLDINIFKKYGNSIDECAIIEEVNTLSLLGKYRLPIAIKREEAKQYEISSCLYTDSELISVALSRLREKTAVRLESADLLKIKTEGEFTESGYVMVNYITLAESIGETVPFAVE